MSKIYSVILILVLITKVIQGQTVQAGISADGTSLVISARPSGALSGNYSGGNVTIIWQTDYGISLGAITSTVGGPWAFQGGVNTLGANSYVDIGWAGSTAAINWTGGSTYELFRVAVNQTGSGTGTFGLTNDNGGGWYFEVGGNNHTEVGTPFYQSSINNVPLPVELTSFSACNNGSNIILNWATATEINNHGFEIERKSFDADALSLSHLKENVWQNVGFVEGNGSSNSTKEYTFTDKSINGGGKFEYRLKQIDTDGSYSYSETVEVTLLPTQFELSQNYPNPFNPATKIKYSIPGNVETLHATSLRVYDILGNEVATLVNERKEPGYYEVEFNASHLTSGVYFYVLRAGDKFNSVKKMMLIK